MKKFTKPFVLIMFCLSAFSAFAGEKLPLPSYTIEKSNVSCGSSGEGSDWLGLYEGKWVWDKGKLESIIIITKVVETSRGCKAKMIASFAEGRRGPAKYIYTVGKIRNGRIKFKTSTSSAVGYFQKANSVIDKRG